jgi:hypothetical protein
MATNTAGHSGYTPQGIVTKAVIEKTVKYTDWSTANAAVTIGVLPPRAVVTGGGIWVITSFDDTNGDDLDVGVAGSDDDLFASAIDLNTGSSLGTLDDLADANRYSASARTVTANFTTAPSGNGTTGEAYVWLEYQIAPVRS